MKILTFLVIMMMGFHHNSAAQYMDSVYIGGDINVAVNKFIEKGYEKTNSTEKVVQLSKKSGHGKLSIFLVCKDDFKSLFAGKVYFEGYKKQKDVRNDFKDFVRYANFEHGEPHSSSSRKKVRWDHKDRLYVIYAKKGRKSFNITLLNMHESLKYKNSINNN